MGEAEFKLRRLESELKTVPAGARASMSTLRLTKRIQEAREVHAAWQSMVVMAITPSVGTEEA